jgi:hypothetical protein
MSNQDLGGDWALNPIIGRFDTKDEYIPTGKSGKGDLFCRAHHHPPKCKLATADWDCAWPIGSRTGGWDLFANMSRRHANPPGSESRILRRGNSSNSNFIGGFDSDPDFAPTHLDNGDLNARFYENTFANLAAQYKHLTPP